MPNTRANSTVDKVGKFGIRAHQPTSVSNAVSFVIEHTGPIFVEVVKGGRFKNIGMDTSNAVYRMRTYDSESSHMNYAVFYDRHSADFVDIIRITGADIFNVPTVNLVYNHIDTREKGFEHIDGPSFESFRQNGMVSISAGSTGNSPSFRPFQVVIVNQYSHQFGYATATSLNMFSICSAK